MEKLANWLQVGANFGLLAGLVLVAIQVNQNSSQLQQSHELTRAGLTNHTYDIWAAIDSTSQSEQFALALSKSLERPEELTLAEIMELDGYLNTIMWHLARIRKLNEMALTAWLSLSYLSILVASSRELGWKKTEAIGT